MMRRLSRDPDTLRIPAFMRKRSLPSLKKQPMILTARPSRSEAKPILRPKGATLFDRKQAGIGIAPPKIMTKPKPKKIKLPFKKALKKKPTAKKSLGTMTHYYDKIKVGVIALNSTLEVGDCIQYQTNDGPYEEIVESMEIDRQPVFKATKGSEIGLKLKKMPLVGTAVQKSTSP